jgi:Holliday junction resolvase-like predicted endonuclease
MRESLVGAYMRQIRGCDSVIYNSRLPGRQGEIDVIGIRVGEPVCVWVAEVAVHLAGLEYGGGYAASARKVTDKVATAREYAERVHQGAEIVIEFWSPIVPSGLLSLLGIAACGVVQFGDGRQS